MSEIIQHSLIHSFEDTIKIIPFLLIIFIILEYLEHSLNNHHERYFIDHSQKYGPVWGSLLGAFPQCGFSIMATNLFAARLITLGTLVAIYLSTSDEMLPILISAKVNPLIIAAIILIKIITGIIVGIAVDRFIHIKDRPIYNNSDSWASCSAKHDNFDFWAAVRRTAQIVLIIFVTGFIINLIIETFGEDLISSTLESVSYLGPFVSGLIGMIPNCASSVVLTQLYVSDVIPLGTAMAGLLSGSGVAWLILFRQNRPFSVNIAIMAIVLISSILVGSLINLIF